MDKSTTTAREDRLIEENAKLKAKNKSLRAENKELKTAIRIHEGTERVRLATSGTRWG